MKNNSNSTLNNVDKNTDNIGEDRTIVGRNAVLELLKTDEQVNAIYVTADTKSGCLNKIVAISRQKGLVVKQANNTKLNELSEGVNHQGVVAVCPVAEYKTLEDIFKSAEQKGKPPFIIMCDEIEDPHNLGAIIRTAEASGADGIIVPKRRSATLNQTVYKTSAGAACVINVVRVSNLTATVEELKKKDIWIYGADAEGQPYDKVRYDGGVCLVIGSEGKGITRLLKEQCDFVVSLPMHGQINSLNASVASGILMYEIIKHR